MSVHERLPRLLLVSGGSLVGQNVVQALGPRRSRVCLLATNSSADEPSLEDFDEVRLVPPTVGDSGGAFERAVVGWIETETPALVIPCRDDDVVFLASLAERRPDLAGRLLCGAPGPAVAMLDKWGSAELSARYGLPFAASAILADEVDVDRCVRAWGFPLIVKPRQGFASRGVRLVFHRSQLDELIGHSEWLVQEYLGDRGVVAEFMRSMDRSGLPLFHSFEETKHSIQAAIDPGGSVIGLFATLHRMRQGVSVTVERDGSPDALALGAQCAEVFSALGWRGALNIQCQRGPDGKLIIYEFNGRYTGATAARTMLGFDEVALLLQAFAGVDLPPLAPNGADVVVRQPSSRATSERLRSNLDVARVWRRDGVG